MKRPNRGPAPTYPPQRYSGSVHDFPYLEIPQRVPEQFLMLHSGTLRKRWSQQFRRWNERLNAEWMMRGYVALERIFSANARLAAALGAPRNLPREEKAALVHGGLYEAAWGLVTVLPQQPWSDGMLLGNLPPAQVVEAAARAVGEVEHGRGRWIHTVLTMARPDVKRPPPPVPPSRRKDEDRRQVVALDHAIPAARFLCEMAQWHSEVLADVVVRQVTPPIGYDFGLLADAASLVTDAGVHVFDDADARRVGALMGSFALPSDLRSLLRELGDDFFTLPAARGEEGEEGGEEDEAESARSLIYPFR